ncbi:hypothetical protein SASPL_123431 [Salvia splendens]|uniref:SET and MYND domain-containing protein n=1 Tax=Salvia splendens TaxID=180675 RepID=A0A8X8XKD2_SALSN|nr:hypothetical protein SASPL_123431 [Salvia splendens]
MEKLKSVIPETLKHKISHSTAADLDSTCSSLLDFFTNLPLFHQLVRDLTDPLVALCGKNKEAALEAKAKGNQCFTDGDYSNALQFYSQALRSAPMDAEDNERNLVATLYLNRASSLHVSFKVMIIFKPSMLLFSTVLYHLVHWDDFSAYLVFGKLGLFLESLQDCNRGLILSPVYAKVMILGSDTSYLYFCFCPCTASTWFRRAKANSSLGYYEDAINDFGVSMEIETSLSGKRQIENELNQLVDQSRLRTSAIEKQHDCSAVSEKLILQFLQFAQINSRSYMTDEPLQVELQCVSTPNKGRGMISLTNIPMASLIHKEDPHGAIILKHCRETHCAFCFKELQADTVPCVSCSIPLYCSLKCQVQAGGEDFLKYKAKYRFKLDLSDDLERHIRNVTSPSFSSPDVKHFAEHRHECQGMHWPAVLPSDVVLAGRVIVKHIEEQAYGGLDHNVHKILDLCQNYGQLSSDTKLEFHVYSIILLCCLQRFYATKLPLNSTKTSEIIMLLSKIRINSMAVVRMKYSDVKQPLNYDLTSSVEQKAASLAIDPSTAVKALLLLSRLPKIPPTPNNITAVISPYPSAALASKNPPDEVPFPKLSVASNGQPPKEHEVSILGETTSEYGLKVPDVFKDPYMGIVPVSAPSSPSLPPPPVLEFSSSSHDSSERQMKHSAKELCFSRSLFGAPSHKPGNQLAVDTDWRSGNREVAGPADVEDLVEEAAEQRENVTAGSEMELSYGPQVGQWDCGKRRMFLKDRYSFICKCSSCAQANLSDLFHGGYRCIKPNCYGVVLDSGVIKYEKEKIGHCERLSCLQDHVPSDDSISKLAHYMYEQTDYHWLEPGSCLGCATFCDLQASKKSISKAEVHIQRMKDAVTSGALTTNLLMNALRYVDILRAKLHPFNRRLAEVEDNIAQAFCLIGDLQAGMDHCRASFEILEKLYGESHIAIGNELIKLASIQFSMGQEISSDYTTRIVAIFSRYYGSHAEIMFPYVRYLKKESCRVV